MTIPKPALAAAALLFLAGCSATHVGDSWQCPLAQGARCTTVASADPMVPDATGKDEAAPDVPLIPTPLYRPRDPGEPVSVPETGRSCEGTCDEGFAPLAWLERLFARIAGEDASAETDGADMTPVRDAAASAHPVDPNTPAGSAPVMGAAAPPPPLPGDAQRGSEAATEAARPPAPPLPADRESTADAATDAPVASAASLPGEAFVTDAALREPEVIGRIWIAPFVDADGHYREASYVRVVLEPAGWRVR